MSEAVVYRGMGAADNERPPLHNLAHNQLLLYTRDMQYQGRPDKRAGGEVVGKEQGIRFALAKTKRQSQQKQGRFRVLCCEAGRGQEGGQRHLKSTARARKGENGASQAPN